MMPPMSFFAILIALLIEQARPLGRGNWAHAMVRAWMLWCHRNLDAGRAEHAWLAWCAAVAGPAALVLVVHWALVWTLGWTLAVLWNVVVLYLTLGFRQFSHHFTGLRDALDAGEENRARELLAQWQQVDASELPRTELVRHVIEFSVLAAHRHVFGVLAWYSMLAALGLGPAGAVLFRSGEFASRYWAHKARVHSLVISDHLLEVARLAWHVIDWLPARMTALGFAVMGSFEEAIDGWRQYTHHADDNDGVLVAATAGAVGVRLGAEALRSADPDEDGAGAAPVAPTPVVAHLRSVVGLVWRTVLLWLVLLALLTLARLLG